MNHNVICSVIYFFGASFILYKKIRVIYITLTKCLKT